MLYIIWFILSTSLSLFGGLFIFSYFDIIKSKELTEDQKKMIELYGITHRTNNKGYCGIKKDNIIRKSKFLKSYSNHFKRCTFFFTEAYKDDVSIKFNVNSKCQYEVIIKKLSNEQMSKLRIRDFDKAVIYMGDFKFSPENIVIWNKILDTKSKKSQSFKLEDLMNLIIGQYSRFLFISIVTALILVFTIEIIIFNLVS